MCVIAHTTYHHGHYFMRIYPPVLAACTNLYKINFGIIHLLRESYKMHPVAWLSAYLFFVYVNDLVISPTTLKILDVGSMDVNGNIRDAISVSNFQDGVFNYTGLDMSEGPNVDIVVTNKLSSWPASDGEFDIIVSSSALEHDSFFWETFTKMASLLRNGGLLYLCVPTICPVHRYPVDNWRMLPDAADVLKAWAEYRGQYVEIIHSSMIEGDGADTVMIFRKITTPSQPEDNAQLISWFATFQMDATRNVKLLNDMLRSNPVISEDQLLLQHSGSTEHRHFPLSYELLQDIPSKHTINSKCRAPEKNQLTHPWSHRNDRHCIIPVTFHIPADDGITSNHCAFEAQFVLTEKDLASEKQLEASIIEMLNELHLTVHDNLGPLKAHIFDIKDLCVF
jgi:SAM-dependent methyltransferase